MKEIIKKVILTVISVITVLSTMPYHTVFADETGSIEITETATNTTDKRTVSGVRLSLYKIADVDSTEALGYRIADSFTDSEIGVKDIVYADNLSDIAENLEKYAANKAIKAQETAETDSNGYLKFNGLSDGIYLIRQVNTAEDFQKAGYEYTTDAYIIAIPSLDSNNNKIRNVVCRPKGILTELKKKDTSLTVYKVWKDDNDKKGARPEEIRVGLYKDGTLKTEVRLNAGNNWMYSWNNLDKDSQWSVKELEVPEGYSSHITNMEQVWTITNTYDTTTPTPTPTPTTPTSTKVKHVKTGDTTNINLWVCLLVISIGAVGAAVYYRRRYKNK